MSGKAWRWIAALAFVGLFVMALRLIGPAVPNEIYLLTGPAGTTFHDDGLAYEKILSQHGVIVHLEETAGSIESLQGLADAKPPTAAFLWGIWDPDRTPTRAPESLTSLGTMRLLPVWIFVNRDVDLERLEDLSGSRIEAGRDGSDARLLAVSLLEGEGIVDEVEFSRGRLTTPEEAIEAVLSNRVGALMATGNPDSMLIDTLLRSPSLRVLSVRRADAFAIQYPFLRPVRLPEGAHDLKANIPDHDVELLAARAQLVVSDQFPPALADLMLQAASEIHGDPTPFSARGEFPNSRTASLPLNRAAKSFYTNGPPALQKFLPFRLASLIDRFLIAVVAIGSGAVAIFKLIPALIGLPFNVKVKRSYRELEAIERRAAAGADRKTVLEELEKLDRSTAAIGAPMQNLRTEWFALRQYVHDMRDRLERL